MAKTYSKEEANKKLDEGLKQIFESERYKDLLNVMSKMTHYSFNNQLLIAMQKPEATMVQGFNNWQELGRYVNKGEKGIQILAPLINKMDMEKIDLKTQKPALDNEGKPIVEKVNVLTGFRPVYVYDVSQTNGKEIPSVRDFINREMSNEEHISKLYKDFFQHVKESFPIREDETEKGVGGYFNRKSNEIVISSNNNENDSLKFRVLIHEYAHAMIHNEESEMKDLPRGHKEAQAESVAYIVSNHYGLDTGDTSLGYIATWSQDIELARKAISEVQEVAANIITSIDELQRDKIQEFYIDNKKEYLESIAFIKSTYDINLSNSSSAPDVQFELLNKDNGYVVSAKLEFNERNEEYHLKTDKNYRIPLYEINPYGDYFVLNKELENGKLPIESYKYVSEQLEIKETGNKYYIGLKDMNISVSKEFESIIEAEKGLLKISVSQSLHEQSFLKNQLKENPNEPNITEKLEANKIQVNYNVGNYLTHGTEQEFFPKGNDGTTIGWSLMKNKNITNLEELKEYAFEKTKNMPTNKALRESINNSFEANFEKDISKTNNQKSEVIELER